MLQFSVYSEQANDDRVSQREIGMRKNNSSFLTSRNDASSALVSPTLIMGYSLQKVGANARSLSVSNMCSVEIVTKAKHEWLNRDVLVDPYIDSKGSSSVF